jgi:transcriptional regulator with XRE-family HTH domain
VSVDTEIREFITSRRARLTLERAGLPKYGRRRRVTGLRREEVALLAGISVEYYTRLERGNARGVSEGVLEAISRALQLDEAERGHLLDLVRTANAERPLRRTAGPQRVRPSVARVVDAMVAIPACVLNGRLDVLYANGLARTLFSDVMRDPVKPPNLARFAFLDPRSKALWVDWDQAARDTVAILRAEAGRNPYDRDLSDLIGQLSTRSEEFRVRWATHDVKFHRTGAKHFHHPLVGDLTLAFELLELSADLGLSLLAYSAEPGSSSEQGLGELARWGATRTRLSGVEGETRAARGSASPPKHAPDAVPQSR